MGRFSLMRLYELFFPDKKTKQGYYCPAPQNFITDIKSTTVVLILIIEVHEIKSRSFEYNISRVLKKVRRH